MRTGRIQLAALRARAASEDIPHQSRSRSQAWMMTWLIFSVIAMNFSVVEAGTLPEYDRVRILSAGPHISDAELTDHNGQPFQLSSLQGRVTLLLFGFAFCPDVCPMGMEKMRRLSSSGRVDSEKITYVMISVDGERDTPAAMKAYVQGFSSDFIGLTGEPAKVKKIAKNFSVAFFKGSVTGEGGEYSVSHSPQIFAIDRQGRLRAEFYSASIEAMAGVTQALLDEAETVSGKENE